jgi:hypothetical protein
MAVLAPAAAPATTRTDLELIQGVWVSGAGQREARLLISGHRFTFEFVGGDLYMGTFDLAHGRMDMHIEAGPAEHIGCWSRCIYRFEEGGLRWCPGRPGSDRRPSAFPDLDDPARLSFVFRRLARGSRR